MDDQNQSADAQFLLCFYIELKLKQQRLVSGMDATLVRNLSDHRGNNLLHVVAGAGDADALAWLCVHFKPQIQDALLDENKRGLTPVVAAIQVNIPFPSSSAFFLGGGVQLALL